MIKGSDALGNLRDYTFDPNGNLIQNSLVMSGVPIDQTTFGYDLSDRRTSATDSAGFSASYQYDAAGNVVAVTDPDGNSVGFAYDPNNKVIKAIDQEGRAVTKTVDLDGKPRAVTDPNGSVVTYEYYGSEKNGRLKSQKDPVGRITQYDYDANGNAISVTDNLGRTTFTTYDELNRPVRIVGPIAGTIRPVTKNTYSARGYLIQVEAGSTTDLTGNVGSDTLSLQMTYLYDDFGRKIQETDALGRSWSFQYDINNNPTTITDPKGQATYMTYGYGHQLLTRNASGSLTTYTRNPLGQVTQAQTPDVTYDYTYDTAHRLQTFTDRRGNKTLEYTYSRAGRLTVMQDSDGNRTDYEYDPVGRLTSIWAPNNDLVSFMYDDGGRLVEKWFPNGVNTQYSYNADNTLQQLLNRTGAGTIISQHDYTYDQVGNRASHNETIAGTTNPYTYAYDTLNRLTTVTNTGTGAVESYTYDPLGNRTTKTTGGVTHTYNYDGANQLTEILSGGSRIFGFVYDNNGNLKTKCEGGTVTLSSNACSGNVVTDLTHDALNHLTQVTKTGISTETYKYDDQGNRIQKSVGGIPVNFLYSGPDIIGQYDSNWNTSAVFTHGPNMDDPIIRVAGTTAQYYHRDGLGSVVSVTNSNGGTDASARYDAWGNRTPITGMIPQYGYTGREPDDTGLVYYRARYYDPTIGRFTQRDPIGMSGGMNLYAYVRGNPVNFNDPLGLSAKSPTNSVNLDLSGQVQLNETSYSSTTAQGQTSACQCLGAQYPFAVDDEQLPSGGQAPSGNQRFQTSNDLARLPTVITGVEILFGDRGLVDRPVDRELVNRFVDVVMLTKSVYPELTSLTISSTSPYPGGLSRTEGSLHYHNYAIDVARINGIGITQGYLRDQALTTVVQALQIFIDYVGFYENLGPYMNSIRETAAVRQSTIDEHRSHIHFGLQPGY